jgi:chromosome segregation ATPase
MTLELLQEYMADKPFLVTLKNLKEQLADAEGKLADAEGKLADAEGKIRELKEELHNERRSNGLEEQNRPSVFETELEKAKEELLPGVEIPHSMNMIKDVFKHPERYRGSINRDDGYL